MIDPHAEPASARAPAPPEAAPIWRLARGTTLTLDRPHVVGVINATPDSFHRASRAGSADAARAMAQQMAAGGAAMLDIGAESTRPGAAPVDAREQVARLMPLLRAIAGAPLPVSVDTTSAAVARAALDAGAAAINDVSGGGDDPALLDVVAGAGAGLVLMHRLAPPERDSYSDRYARPPRYGDVIAEVRAALEAMMATAEARGVAREAIVLDPGLGFGKTVEQNLTLLGRAGEIGAGGRPVLIGASRKSFVGRSSLGRDSEPGERLAGSIAAAALGAASGALLIRTHDVAETAPAARLGWALRAAAGNRGG